MTGAHTKGTGWGPPKDENERKIRARMRARYKLEKEGLVHRGDGKEVDHIKPLSKGGSEDARSNLRVKPEHWNAKQGGTMRQKLRKK